MFRHFQLFRLEVFRVFRHLSHLLSSFEMFQTAQWPHMSASGLGFAASPLSRSHQLRATQNAHLAPLESRARDAHEVGAISSGRDMFA